MHLPRLLCAAALLGLTACGGESTTETDQEQPTVTDASTIDTLQAKLDAKKAQWAENASDSEKTLYDTGIETIIQSGVYDTMKKVGDKAPDFTLPDSAGNDVSLSGLLAEGPVIIVFYRGAWCPYCNITLAEWQAHADQVKALGAQIVAISPQKAEYSLESKEKNELGFAVLSDVGSKTSDAFGITSLVTPEILELWKSKGFIDLAVQNGEAGEASGKLPLPATYLIDREGTILYAFAEAEYRNRAEPKEVITKLSEITGK